MSERGPSFVDMSEPVDALQVSGTDVVVETETDGGEGANVHEPLPNPRPFRVTMNTNNTVRGEFVPPAELTGDYL